MTTVSVDVSSHSDGRRRGWTMAVAVFMGAVTVLLLSAWSAWSPLLLSTLVAGGLVALVLDGARRQVTAGAAAGLLGGASAMWLTGAARAFAPTAVPASVVRAILGRQAFMDQAAAIFAGRISPTAPGVLGGLLMTLVVTALVAGAAAAVSLIVRLATRRGLVREIVAVALLVAVCAAFVQAGIVDTRDFRARVATRLAAGSYAYDAAVYLNTYYEMRDGGGYYRSIVRAAAGDSRLIREHAVEAGKFVGWAPSPAFIRQPWAVWLWRIVAPDEAGQVTIFSLLLCAGLMGMTYWALRPHLGLRALFGPILLYPGLIALNIEWNTFFPDWWAALALTAGFLLMVKKKWIGAALLFAVAALFREVAGLWLGAFVVLALAQGWRLRDRRWLRRAALSAGLLAAFFVAYWLHLQAGAAVIVPGSPSPGIVGMLQASAARSLRERFVVPASYMMWPYYSQFFRGAFFVLLQLPGYWLALRRDREAAAAALAFAGFWVLFTTVIGGTSPNWGQLYVPVAVIGTAALVASIDDLPGIARKAVSGTTVAGTRAERVIGTPATVRFVLPAFNEAASIRDLIDRIAEVMTSLAVPYEVIVVDDGSADDTAAIAEAAGRDLPVRLLRNPRNMGLGATIAHGLRFAAGASGSDDVIVTMDADLTQDPVYVSAMIDAWRDGADVVIASRFRSGSRVHGLSPFRHFMTFGARIVMSTLMRVPGVRDYSCGYRLYAAPVLQTAFETMGDAFISQTGFACMVEIIVKLRDAAVMAEVPFELRYDAKRKPSTMRIGRTVRAYFEVIEDARRIRRGADLNRVTQ